MTTLREARESNDLTVRELAELSGISVTTIYEIESGSKTHKINEAVAEALAGALYCEPKDLFHSLDLSHLGRPPMTGVSCKKHKETIDVCPACNLAAVRAGYCTDCDRPVTLAS